jgi:hypothetical protein
MNALFITGTCIIIVVALTIPFVLIAKPLAIGIMCIGFLMQTIAGCMAYNSFYDMARKTK